MRRAGSPGRKEPNVSPYVYMVYMLTIRAYMIADHMPVLVYALVLGVV